MESIPKATSRKVLVIGWDGADWKVASPLVDAGKMPNLQRLINGGVMGNISTLYPVLSPMLWTSIATGKRAHKHGIHGFAEPDTATNTVRPITNLSRKCKAIWNILNQSGKKCNVVGWWPSNPAEPIDGVMVSNHFQTAPAPREDKQWPMKPGTIHPSQLSKQLAKFRVHPFEIQPDQILPFIPEAARVDQAKDTRISAVAKTLAECSSVHAVTTAIMQHEPWDFMAVYYDAIDHFSHGFMKFHPPREDWVSESDFEIYKHVIETAYCFHDLMLGALLTLAGPDTTVILLSDHGFHPDHLRPQVVSNEPAGPADEHRRFGMLVVNGPGIKKDELVFGASLLDITPTILTMYGLPVGRDMDGKSLVSVFEEPTNADLIDSWEQVPGNDGRHPEDLNVAPVDAHESLQQLVELGYIEKPDEDQNKATRQTVRELRYNLARDYMDSHHLPEAIREFEQLWDEFPDESRFGVKLFNCYLKSNDVDRAESTLKRLVQEKKRYSREAAIEIKKWQDDHGEDFDASKLNQKDARRFMRLRRRAVTNPNTFSYLRGSLLHAKGEFHQALKVRENATGAQTYNQPSLVQKRGQCYLGLEQWKEAKIEFDKMLELEPANAGAYLGLAQSELGFNHPKKAVSAARSSIGLVYHNPTAHFVLGHALLKLGRKKQALEALHVAIQQNTVFPDCHRLLAKLFKAEGDLTKSEKHERLAEKAAQRLQQYRDGSAIPVDADLELDIAMDQTLGIAEVCRSDMTYDLANTVVVVSGLPRSGTSMMMQMLQSGGFKILADEIREADPSNPNGYFEYEPVKKLGDENGWVNEACGHAVKIVTHLLPELPRDLKYIVIYMARPLNEVVTSQSKMLARLNRSGARISNRQLAAIFKKQVDYVSNSLQDFEDVTALNVDYADAISDPIAVSKKINQLLGGSLDVNAMASAVDPSLRNEGK